MRSPKPFGDSSDTALTEQLPARVAERVSAMQRPVPICVASSGNALYTLQVASADSGSTASLLRALREQRGSSLRLVAEELGVAASQLSRIERGQRGLGEGLPERMAQYYGVSSDVIALAEGRVPEDILLILAEHPGELELLRDKYQSGAEQRAYGTSEENE